MDSESERFPNGVEQRVADPGRFTMYQAASGVSLIESIADASEEEIPRSPPSAVAVRS